MQPRRREGAKGSREELHLKWFSFASVLRAFAPSRLRGCICSDEHSASLSVLCVLCGYISVGAYCATPCDTSGDFANLSCTMFDDPEETPAERSINPADRAREKFDEFRMHAELAAVFEGCRKFDAQILPTLDPDIARDIQRTIG